MTIGPQSESRTRMDALRTILSRLRLPFRHPGTSGNRLIAERFKIIVSSLTRCNFGLCEKTKFVLKMLSYRRFLFSSLTLEMFPF